MNAILRKEIRLVLPAWALAMLLATVPVWFLWPTMDRYLLEPPGASVWAPYGLGLLLLALASFGHELNFGTLSSLLAQPISRQTLWRLKIGVLTVSVLTVYVAWFISNQVRAHVTFEFLTANELFEMLSRPSTQVQAMRLINENRQAVMHQSLVVGAAAALAAFAGGLWTTLLFRQTSIAFWFTLVVPLGLGLLAQRFMGDTGMFCVLVAYAVAGFLWARRYFLGLQDVPWTGGSVSLPSWFTAKRDSAELRISSRRPWRALFAKEFHLQQMNYIVAGFLLLSHLLVLAVRRFSLEYFEIHRSAGMVWESWPILWLAMPLLIGGVAVAEERRLGTLEGLLCLPTTRWREFLTKLFMCLALGGFFGGIMPLLLESLGLLTGLRNGSASILAFDWELVSLTAVSLGGSAGLSLIALYASTLSRNLLQSLGLAVVLTLLCSGVIGGLVAIGNVEWDRVPLWRGNLIGVIGMPVMITAVVFLAYRNFRQLNIQWQVWRRNLLVLTLALGATASTTTILYHRVWEIWMQEEPIQRMQTSAVHSVLTKANEVYPRPQMDASSSKLAVLQLGGQLWLAERKVTVREIVGAGATNRWLQPSGSWKGAFVPNFVWNEVAVGENLVFAIRTNGTLWDLSAVEAGSSSSAAKPFDTGTDWKSLAAGLDHFIALKADGTLWEWGEKRVRENGHLSATTIQVPIQIGHDSNWIAVAKSQAISLAVKEDGTIWRWGYRKETKTNSGQNIFVGSPEYWLSGPRKRPISIALHGSAIAIVYLEGWPAAGSLYLGGEVHLELLGRNQMPPPTYSHMVAVEGSSSDWREIRFLPSAKLVGTKKDGTLWIWKRDSFWEPGRVFVGCSQASRYATWLAITGSTDGFLALSSDGSLCEWEDPNLRSIFGHDPRGLLGPSRVKASRIAKLAR